MDPIVVPGHVPELPEMESTPTRALTFATNLRAVTAGVKEVQEWASSDAAPGWAGETAQAHAHATTRFAVRLDGAEAALDRAVVAADRFERRLSRLAVERHDLDVERLDVNGDADFLLRDIRSATDDSQEPGLRRRASSLAVRAGELTRAIARWTRHYAAAEADFIAALRAVDTLAEGGQAAVAPDRVDATGLAPQLARLLGDPVAVAAWWKGLSRAQRQALLTERPELVGNAGGVPARDRDEANRAALHRDLDHGGERAADGQLTGAERRALQNATTIRDQLDKYHDRLDPATGRELTHLLVYKPTIHSGDGGVAISFGDPDTADHVSINVPGLTSDTSSTDGNLTRTMALHDATLAERNGSVASVHWLDYDAPSGNPLDPFDPGGALDFDGVVLTHKADVGGERLADFIDGLRASDDGPRAHVTVIGHSYGSTAAGHALQDGMRVDDAVLIGSPGQPAPTAAELTSAHVWVGSKDYDPVSLLGHRDRGGIGALGHDPATASFGGTRFATGDGSLRAEDLLANHTSYFKGESLANMAHIAGGRDAEVTVQPARGAEGGDHLTLDQLVVAAAESSVLDRLHDAGDWLQESSPLGGRVSR